MKSNYQTKITLLCKSCGSNDIQLTDDKTYAKCNNCQREYSGGYDELVSLNQKRIDKEVDKMRNQVIKDAEEEINKMIKKAFGGR
ncbi:hypothetical protein [Dyadobacter frigoris]|uniref:Uncharacterized protein n=1 Tax=Dyadobacter frigoris TaxID=2576211 RepID=A0A4U6DDK1_9BACT|nr:hypothetical protein [Dyadobacter frigoris]TKT92514.1 hypothetical protein FDK13_11180 [Dyadobacter frigoris]GLU55308.1 hypothetical protein Dfri01_47690 [Dyadobacter frigoris]